MSAAPDLPALSQLDSLADLEPDAAVGGAVNALRGVLVGGTPAQALRAAEMICRVWLAERRGAKVVRPSPERERRALRRKPGVPVAHAPGSDG